jgi:hypothetical protein
VNNENQQQQLVKELQQRNDVLLRERDAFIATLKKERIELLFSRWGSQKAIKMSDNFTQRQVSRGARDN